MLCPGLIYLTYLPLRIYMWIGSQLRFMVRSPNTSPLGNQSSTLDNNIPALGSWDDSGTDLSCRKVLTTTNNIPHLFITAISQHHNNWEDRNDCSISQWWGHHGNRDSRGLQKVSDSDRFCQLTIALSYPTSWMNPNSYVDRGQRRCWHCILTLNSASTGSYQGLQFCLWLPSTPQII